MTNYPEIAPFNDKFEDVHIYINKLIMSTFGDADLGIFPAVSPYTSVWHEMSVTGFPDNKDLVGKLFIMFRNQGKDQRMVISMDMIVRARATSKTASADTFCKTIQYLFDWTGQWAKEIDLRDQYNEPFVMPAFLYSKSHFEAALPE